MKEVKKAREQQEQLLSKIEARTAFYYDVLKYETGDGNTEKQTKKINRKTLYEEIWKISLSKVAKKYDVPYDKLRSACIKAEIPLPSLSYWGNRQAGKPVRKTPLPESSKEEVTIEYSYRIRQVEMKDCHESDILSFMSEDEKAPVIKAAFELRVDPDLKRIHPILQNHKRVFHEWATRHPRDKYADWNRDKYRSVRDKEPPLWECVTEETLSRVYCLLDPIFRSIEKLGGVINEDLSMQIRNERVDLKITEGRDQVPHVLTKSEQQQLEKYEQDSKRYSFAYEPKFRKYDYIPNGKLRVEVLNNACFRDSNTAGVESKISEIFLALYMRSEDVRLERLKREEAERKEKEAKKKKELEQQKYNDEVDKFCCLLNESQDYETACMIRNYIKAVESKQDLDEDTQEWIKWANAKADWVDPTVDATDDIFGRRDHGEDEEKKMPHKNNRFYYW